MAESEGPFVILIDTNAMAGLSLYVESCAIVGAAFGVSPEELKRKFKEVKNTQDNQLYLKGRGSIKNGYQLFGHLGTKIKEFDTVQIWFSLLSEIELLNVFLERVFDQELTRKGIPYRIRRKKPFRTQIDFDYEAKIANYWADIKEKLAEFDIKFDNPEKDSEAIHDIIKIAKILTRHVALEPMDLYLYASGIHLRADEIYTHDKELRTIINNIRTEEWKNVYKNIQQDLRETVRPFEDEFQKERKINFPEGVPTRVS